MEKDGMALPGPSDPKWLMDWAPLVDITPKLNVLNKKFRGHGQLVSVACDNEHRSIRYRTCVMESPAFPDKLLTNFSTHKALMDSGTPFSREKYTGTIVKLEEFNHRFCRLLDTRKKKLFKFLLCCLGVSSGSCDFLAALMFVENLFSTMNFNKSKLRSKLTDKHLSAILRVSAASSLEPNVTQLCKRKHCQVPGSKEEEEEGRGAEVLKNRSCSVCSELMLMRIEKIGSFFFENLKPFFDGILWCDTASPRLYWVAPQVNWVWPLWFRPVNNSLRRWEDQTMKLKPHNPWRFIITGTVCYTK